MSDSLMAGCRTSGFEIRRLKSNASTAPGMHRRNATHISRILKYEILPKLKALKCDMKSLPNRLRYAVDDDGHSKTTEPWRKLYSTERWRNKRLNTFKRDRFTCKHDGCGRFISDTSQLVCHHIIAHRGDPVLFWDDDNLTTVCKPCHDGPIQKEEAAARQRGEI